MERERNVNHLIYWPLDGALALPSFEWNKGCFWGMLSLRSHQTGQNNGRKVQYTRIFMPGKNTPTSKAGSLARNGRSTQKSERVRFSGHQTFVARNGWLEKGVRLIQDDPGGFLAADSVVRLGVGKNMVESIKYWCLQTGLVEDGDKPSTMRCTDLGRFLFGDGDTPGVDPFLEDDASLWLLHYQMVAHAPLSTWSMMLNHYNKSAFRKKDADAIKMAEAASSVPPFSGRLPNSM